MTTTDMVTIPPVPEAPAGAVALILDAGPDFRIVFALGGQMPTDSQQFGMRRHIEREMSRRWTEYGTDSLPLSWRWDVTR